MVSLPPLISKDEKRDIYDGSVIQEIAEDIKHNILDRNGTVFMRRVGNITRITGVVYDVRFEINVGPREEY